MKHKTIIKLGIALFLSAVALAGCNNATKTTSAENGKEDTATFINSPEGLTGELAKNYVGFRFDYPKSWKMDAASSQDGASNFVRIERSLNDEHGSFTQENFAVGYFEGSGSPETDKTQLPKIAKQLEKKFAHDFPEYTLISESPAKLGEYSGYEFRFSSIVKESPHGDIVLWGRTILLPNPTKGEKHGVTIVMMGSSLTPDIKSGADLGVKGELPIILNSFRLGSDGEKQDNNNQ